MFFFFQAEDGIRDWSVTGVQTCALPIWRDEHHARFRHRAHSRDWRAQSDRRQEERHHVAVFDRSRYVDGPRRNCWSIDRLGTDSVAATPASVLRAALGAGWRLAGERRHRSDFPPLA